MALLDLECERCSYRFSAKDAPQKCPYCDKVGTIRKVQTAQDLIDEAVSEADFFQDKK
jgi:Zn finger protein HypA/HybF involved in hydrogenase expression